MNSEISAEELLIANQSVRERNFWLEQLKGCEEKTSIDYDLPGTGEATASKHSWQLADETVKVLLTMSKERNEALQVILLASTVVFLQKYTTHKTIVLATPALTDLQARGSGMKILPLVFVADTGKGFKEAVMQCREIIREANAHRHFPLQALLQYQYREDAQESAQVFDIGMALTNIQDDAALLQSGTSLNFLFNRSGDHINCCIQYNTSRYQAATVQQLAIMFSGITANLVREMDKPLRLIPLAGAQQQEEAARLLQPVRIQFPIQYSIHDLFRKKAAAVADHTAVACENEYLTYAALDKRSDKLAARLTNTHALAQGSVVVLILERSIDAVVAMLGVLKAGSSYLHIESGTPLERIRYMLNDSDAALVLTQELFISDLHASKIAGCPIEFMDTMDTWTDTVTQPLPVSSDSIAYIIFTSGSTGKPKAVAIEHKSCLNLVFAMNESIIGKYGDNQVMGLVSPFIFDACVQLVFGALLFGHQLRILTNAERSDGKLLQESYNCYQVTVSDGTPSHINLLIQAWSKHSFQQYLKLFISGGEALHASRLQEWYRLMGNTVFLEITNVYGPTECTVNATYYNLPGDAGPLPALIPIGKPLANYRLYIVDENEECCAIGQPGQLCIAGDGLMRGYVNNPNMTADKIKYVAAAGRKVYLTGDRVRLLPDGNISFIGRMDSQVKIRGYRIELTEIETHINKHAAVVQSVVVVKHDNGDNAFLVAYYESPSLEPEALRNDLSQRIPGYMLPACFTRVDEFVYLANKKINRAALPEPTFPKVRGENDLPANETEMKLQQLWQESLLLPGSSIGVNDNYFNIGGDSIKTISLLYDINEAFNMHFSIADLYKFDTIRKFAAEIRTGHPAAVQNNHLLEAEEEMDRLKNAFMDRLS